MNLPELTQKKFNLIGFWVFMVVTIFEFMNWIGMFAYARQTDILIKLAFLVFYGMLCYYFLQEYHRAKRSEEELKELMAING